MSELQFEDGDQIVPTTRSARSRTAPKKGGREADEAKDDQNGNEKKEAKRRQSQTQARMPLYIGLGVGGFVVLVLVVVVVALTLGSTSSSGSYTDRAFSAYVNGYGADYYRKRKTPSSQDVEKVRKLLKNYKAGTADDFKQGLRVLNQARDHSDYVTATLGTSEYLRDTFSNVFGSPNSSSEKAPFPPYHIWRFRCSDKTVELWAFAHSEDGTNYLKVMPPKTQQHGK
jgi:hypothetical protein